MEENKSKFHNYIAVVVLFLVCIGVVLYLCKIYKVNEEEKLKTPVIDGYLSEIYQGDLEHYILDNPTAVMYMCTANGDTCRAFERDFKKLLKKNNYNNQIIYLNLTDLNQDDFVNHFNEQYRYKIKLTTDYPAFVLFEDGNVRSVLQGSSKKPLSITKVRQFLELNEIGEE